MPALPFDPILLSQPLEGERPSGPDMEYEPAFMALVTAGAGKPERQYGKTVYPAEPPEWPAVLEAALAICASTRDLRVSMWVLRCAARMFGLAGAAAGLQLLSTQLIELWSSVHPQLDASDHDDPTMRLSALAPLSAADAALADLRAMALAPVRGSLTMRELELGLGKVPAAKGETVPTEEGVLKALKALTEAHPEIGQQSATAFQSAKAMSAWLDDRLGAAHSADLSGALRLLGLLDNAVRTVMPPPPPPPEPEPEAETPAAAEPGAAPAAAAPKAAPVGAILTRADAARELQRVIDWLEKNEPANPSPILLRRGLRLMNMSFLDIMRNLAPDGLTQIRLLEGPEETPP